MRGFIDDLERIAFRLEEIESLNPRSCAASSMTQAGIVRPGGRELSQSAFVRGFIDDRSYRVINDADYPSLNPRSCAASSMTGAGRVLIHGRPVSIRVRARLHR